MSKEKLCWHGEPVKTEFGMAFVKKNVKNPLWWYNYYVGTNTIRVAYIPSIKVTTKSGQSFIIANMYGIGWLKLKKGGWPNITHFSLPDDSFKGSKGWHWSLWNIRSFDEENYAKERAESDQWFKQVYGDTEEYKRMQSLKEIIQKTQNQ